MKTKIYNALKGNTRGRYIATNILLKVQFSIAVAKLMKVIKNEV